MSLEDRDEVGEILSPSSIHLGRRGDSMHDAIEFVGNELVELGVVTPSYIDAMRQREQTVSTYLGNGVALPHGTFETKSSITATAVVVAQYPDGVDWGDNVAHLVIGLAAAGDDHVHVLSQIAEVLQDEALCRTLWRTDDRAFVHETLTGGGAPPRVPPVPEVSRDIKILNPAGLHARPAALIVEQATAVASDVEIVRNGKSADAKSIMSVLALGASTGDVATVIARGEDAAAAVEAIAAILESTSE